jgi:hypothetical protein
MDHPGAVLACKDSSQRHDVSGPGTVSRDAARRQAVAALLASLPDKPGRMRAALALTSARTLRPLDDGRCFQQAIARDDVIAAAALLAELDGPWWRQAAWRYLRRYEHRRQQVEALLAADGRAPPIAVRRPIIFIR